MLEIEKEWIVNQTETQRRAAVVNVLRRSAGTTDPGRRFHYSLFMAEILQDWNVEMTDNLAVNLIEVFEQQQAAVNAQLATDLQTHRTEAYALFTQSANALKPLGLNLQTVNLSLNTDLRNGAISMTYESRKAGGTRTALYPAKWSGTVDIWGRDNVLMEYGQDAHQKRLYTALPIQSIDDYPLRIAGENCTYDIDEASKVVTIKRTNTNQRARSFLGLLAWGTFASDILNDGGTLICSSGVDFFANALSIGYLQAHGPAKLVFQHSSSDPVNFQGDPVEFWPPKVNAPVDIYVDNSRIKKYYEDKADPNITLHAVSEYGG